MRLLFATILAAASLHAAPFAFTFTGQVTRSSGSFPTGAAVGDLVDGSGSFEVNGPDWDADPNRYYQTWLTGSYYLDLNVHTSNGLLSFHATVPTGLHMWNYDQVTFPPGDYWQFSAYGPSSNLALNQLLGNHEITFDYMDGLAPFDMLDGITPPPGFPDFSKVTASEAYVRSSVSDSYFRIDFSFDPTPVPEPATTATAGVALLALGLCRRRQ